MLKEDFLNYVWQHQYFNKTNLQTLEGEPLQIIRTGLLNTNAGPDFLGATVKIGAVTWNGSIEMHVKASEWLRHQHQQDARYDQVILHIVWDADQPISRTDSTLIPILALKQLVEPGLLQSYLALKKEKPTFPCQPFLKQVPELPKMQMLDRVLMERLEQKRERITLSLAHNNNDWEETTYQALLANFGFKINQEPFQRLSKVIPFAIVRKLANGWQLEALFFGQAGFLEELPPEDKYLQKLQQEYRFLKHKYSLPAGLATADWNFLRLRPANFPTVRLAQVAAFLQGKSHLFATLINLPDVQAYFDFLEGAPSAYWQTHYMPGRESKTPLKGIGAASKAIILINTVVPLLFAYARQQDSQVYIDKALGLLEKLKPEKNSVAEVYEQEGVRNKSAADSQGILQLNQYYCIPRQCLGCSIGHFILKSNLIGNDAA